MKKYSASISIDTKNSLFQLNSRTQFQKFIEPRRRDEPIICGTGNLKTTSSRAKIIFIFDLKLGRGYLYGRVQISAWFILSSLHANPDPESVTK